MLPQRSSPRLTNFPASLIADWIPKRAGTGKTVCARLYGELLEELGVLPKGSCFVETSGAKLVSGGVAALQDALDETKDGGLLFVDEAYQLNPSNNTMGGQVLDVLLTEMENRRGSLVVAFAGYADRMEDLLDYNEGLCSRFRLVWNFDDFSVDELVEIITQQLASMTPPFTAADKHVRIMARRLGRQRGTRGFGNARAVRNWLENSRDRPKPSAYCWSAEPGVYPTCSSCRGRTSLARARWTCRKARRFATCTPCAVWSRSKPVWASCSSWLSPMLSGRTGSSRCGTCA